ncbi:YhgE/Pip domain-containing protein [Pullulanibacillus sp. KACC 23026]|uniref:YhgE/Pip domain-containing protein n=1 Tax=Pullulanibacillus sp. KACC 23026 TaxID=3028315 RepID=UPI0023AFD15C|nr:YhgE/Pip domain-containing protein [Pullulanibacillus sp. KACC 23026]WEG12179.1 YhgE/Pip domain-containing protein [Pullulanibacillus sp. KACC 23026]
MKRSIFGEWRAILTNRKLLIPVIAIFFIPCMYAGMFLWAFWNPYGHLNRLPVAIVNQDKGAALDGDSINVGKDFVTNLKKDKTFDYKVMSQKEANAALNQNKLYMIIEIPKNFSENAATLTNDNPKKMQLTYVPNEGYNYISGQIDKNAMNEIKASVQENVTKTYSETVFGKLKDAAKGFKEASSGAKKLDQGASGVNKGADQVHSGLKSLATNTAAFKDGLSTSQSGTSDLLSGVQGLSSGLNALQSGEGQLLNGVKASQSGTNDLASGISQVASGLNTVDSKMQALNQGTQKEATGVNQLNQSMPALQKGAADTAAGASQLNQSIAQMEQQMIAQLDQASEQELEGLLPYLQASMTPEQLADFQAKAKSEEDARDQQIKAYFDQLKDGSSNLASGSNELSQSISNSLVPSVSSLNQGMGQINQGQQQLSDAVHKLSGGAADLNTGVKALQSGENQLLSGSITFNEKLQEAAQGSNQVLSGTQSLNQGLSQLLNGAIQLNNGSEKLATGSGTLATGTKQLASGTHQLSSSLGDAASQAAPSLKANDKTYNMMASPVQLKSKTIHKVSNYGTGFAAYFLSLGLFVGALLISVVYPFVEPAIKPKSGWAWYSSKFFTLAGIGVFQSFIAVAVILFGLGLKVQSVPLFILTALITSFTFITLIQLLVSALGDPGRYLAIMILILQLTTCGGTFPVELIPSALQPIHSFLPMNYSMLAFKSVISLGDAHLLWQSLLILIGYAVVFIILASLVFQAKFKKTYSLTQEEAA